MIDVPEDSVILVCMLVADAKVIARGSVRVPCDNCGRQCWRAPGPPPAVLDDDNRLKLVSPFVPQPPPTIVLCVSCAQAHFLLHQGTQLPTP
jgi:hypothetical protein